MMGAPWLERYGKAGGTEVWWIHADECCAMPNQSVHYLIDFSMNLTHLEVSVSSRSLLTSVPAGKQYAQMVTPVKTAASAYCWG